MTTTFNHTPISYENLEFVNQENETMDNHNLGFVNEVMGATIVYENY